MTEQIGTLREYSTPIQVVPADDDTLARLLDRRVERNPAATMLERKSDVGGAWQKISAQEFRRQARAVAKGLIASGIGHGESVGVMAATSYEWSVLDAATWYAGAVLVPVYETSSAEQVEWMGTDAAIKLMVTSDAATAAIVAQARPAIACLEEVLSISQDALGTLAERGAAVSDEELEARTAAVSLDDVMTIIYTSGTTGRPKGVVLKHRQFSTLVQNGLPWLAEVINTPQTRLLLFLPLAHSYARLLNVLSLLGPGVLGHAPGPATLLDDLAAFAPSYVLAVPRVFEKIYNSADAKAGSGVKLKLFRWAAKVAITYSRALDKPGGPSAVLKAQHRLASRLVLNKLTRLLGPNAKYAISGGGPLGDRLGHFYRGMGLSILEGYGLTETTAPISVNSPQLNKLGTVGPPVPGASIRIGDGGEILVKGDQVFEYYHNNPEATAEVIDADGWFNTGDIGQLDADGYLRITGRAKEIIVTAGGKNVAPAVLEDRLRGHPLVSQVVVVGDNRPFIAALVTLDKEMLPGWLSNHGLPGMGVDEAAKHPKVLEALDRAVARANKAVSRAESIRKIKVLTTDFTEANGLLTPSLKVRRAIVTQRFAADIEELYAGVTTGPAEG
ncbi:AMP-dependent synthetase/ligase [Buchananella felis]|uniref:AMP-dependent synthetase/ligase n=1 Tax=Buchananella felis TaxID=3231492 RepID=UPI0035271DEB